MKESVINVVSDDAVEIIAPGRRKDRLPCPVICLCCERADQPMDDDGCGICDVCLGLPVQTKQNTGDLAFPMPPPHLSFTARNR
ncbi:UNVERIFIED_ORG: hypothetical protein LHK14_16165 [Roseateles sp. XES5]|nr:hypothetical protein [Roseateles sp. XES5]